jgi:5-methyltetrahydropteroyltriglutamate--homocysteine methyltransferase
MKNDYYPNDEAYLVAIADAMHEEYKAIVEAGFLLQIDDDLPDGWRAFEAVPEYRKYAELRVDALNHGLRDIPAGKVRFHTCWGSYHGPHKYDIPLRDIVDLILKVRADTISIEAANPRHEHEWRVWQEVKLPEGKVLVPGVVGHATDIVEHPQAIADRLARYAKCRPGKRHGRHRLGSARAWAIRRSPGQFEPWLKAPHRHQELSAYRHQDCGTDKS